MNCVWERVIRSIHKILTVLLGQQLANEEMLCTLMAEVQGILKSRHLTPVSNNAKDLELLTTNHLLLLLPPGVFVKEDTYWSVTGKRCNTCRTNFGKLAQGIFTNPSTEAETVQSLPSLCC